MNLDEIQNPATEAEALFNQWNDLDARAGQSHARNAALCRRVSDLARDFNRKSKRGQDVTPVVAKMRLTFAETATAFAETGSLMTQLSTVAKNLSEKL